MRTKGAESMTSLAHRALAAGGRMTYLQLAQSLGVTPTRAQSAIGALRKNGLVTQIGVTEVRTASGRMRPAAVYEAVIPASETRLGSDPTLGLEIQALMLGWPRGVTS